MKLLSSLAGGLAGALSVTLLHELLRKADPSAPRLDKLGQQATKKLIEKTGCTAPTGKALYLTSLAGDVIANTLFYSTIGARPQQLITTGAVTGLAAGAGAVILPKHLGLKRKYTASTYKRKIITVGLYTAGGLVAAAVINALKGKKK